jgi:hypothetical protein
MTRRNKLEASPDLIAEFQLIVRRCAAAEEGKIELPTSLLVSIAESLKYVRPPPGQPGKSGRVKVRQAIAISLGRGKIAKLKSEGYSPDEARDRVAHELKRAPLFKKLSLATIKDRLRRRRSKRRPPAQPVSDSGK